MARYSMIANTESRPQVFRVIDTERPTMVIAGVGTNARKVVCECAEEGDAMMIVDALNKAELV